MKVTHILVRYRLPVVFIATSSIELARSVSSERKNLIESHSHSHQIPFPNCVHCNFSYRIGAEHRLPQNSSCQKSLRPALYPPSPRRQYPNSTHSSSSDRLTAERDCYTWTVRSQYTIFDEPSSALEHLLYTLQQLGYSKSSRFVLRLSSSHSDFVLTVTASSILCLPSWTLLTGQESLSIRQIRHLYKEFRSVTTSQQTSCAPRMRKGSSRGTVPLRMMASTRDMLDFRKTSISNTQHSTTTISLDPILTQSTVLRMKVHVDLHQFDRRVKMLNVRHELDSKTLCLA